MGFEEFLPAEKEDEIKFELKKTNKEEKIGQSQFFGIITSKKPDWQQIIFDLIQTEQLDPWDIDIVILTQKYFEKILEIEEAQKENSDEEIDFYLSSKVLLAAALLLRIKSEFLLNKHIRNIDEILFGKKEESKKPFERIEIDENELPILIPKTPMARMRRVTLPELIAALNKAINTETRRIKREVAVKRAKKLSEVDFPTFKRIDLKDRIRQVYAKILTSIKKIATGPEKHLNKVSYSLLVGKEKEEKLACFLPILHLSNSKKLWLEQEKHLDEIWVYLYEYFSKNKEGFIKNLEEEIEEMKEEMETAENVEGDFPSGLEKARQKLEDKRNLEEEARKELEQELGKNITEIDSLKQIEKISGFSDS